ncbi:MAG: DMT family protein [Steroidobacteraceae bacterium]
MSTILLLSLSNVFMTFAWYGHLKYGHDWPLWKAILISWCIALLEYCLAVPANRFGFVQFSGFQLKIIQASFSLRKKIANRIKTEIVITSWIILS